MDVNTNIFTKNSASILNNIVWNIIQFINILTWKWEFRNKFNVTRHSAKVFDFEEPKTVIKILKNNTGPLVQMA